jgi:hypothetical protein
MHILYKKNILKFYYIPLRMFRSDFTFKVTYNLHDKRRMIYITHEMEQTHMDVI